MKKNKAKEQTSLSFGHLPLKKGEVLKKILGFTLVELLVVISIIAILTMVTVGSFVESQKKSRDGARKANLKSLSEAISMYYADTGSFPGTITYNSELSRNGTIYMKKTPIETSSSMLGIGYTASVTRKSFRLITNLENDGDKDCVCYVSKTPTCSSLNLNYTISSGCAYIITSSNVGATDNVSNFP